MSWAKGTRVGSRGIPLPRATREGLWRDAEFWKNTREPNE